MRPSGPLRGLWCSVPSYGHYQGRRLEEALSISRCADSQPLLPKGQRFTNVLPSSRLRAATPVSVAGFRTAPPRVRCNMAIEITRKFRSRRKYKLGRATRGYSEPLYRVPTKRNLIKYQEELFFSLACGRRHRQSSVLLIGSALPFVNAEKTKSRYRSIEAAGPMQGRWWRSRETQQDGGVVVSRPQHIRAVVWGKVNVEY